MYIDSQLVFFNASGLSLARNRLRDEGLEALAKALPVCCGKRLRRRGKRESRHGWMVMVDGDWLVRWNEKTHNIYIYIMILWYMYVYIFFVFIPIHSYTGYTYNYQCSMIYVYRCMMLNDSYSDIIWTAFEWHYICCCFKHPWMIVLERTVGVMLQPIHWSDQAWGVWIWEFHTEHWLNWI